MPLKVITIDFWNTLFRSDVNGAIREQERFRIVAHHAQRLGYTPTLEELLQAQQHTWQEFKRIWKESHRTPTTEELALFFWQQLNILPDDYAMEEVLESFAKGVLEHPPELLPGAREILEELASRYKLALISDTAFSPGEILYTVMESAGIAHLFSAFSFSDQTGVAKPHPDAFLFALRKINAHPSEALHIGDLERTDIYGAKNLGMKAILYCGDTNAILEEEYRHKTIADATVQHWNEVPEAIEKITGGSND